MSAFCSTWCVLGPILGPIRIEESAHTFPVDSITLGILIGESYNGIRALADFFVMLKYPIAARSPGHGATATAGRGRGQGETREAERRRILQVVVVRSGGVAWRRRQRSSG